MGTNAPIITLLSDFGTQDPYVASMKGVIASIAPEAAIHDLSHDIQCGDVIAAALFLETTLPLFPTETIHIAVVDPGVGTGRHPIVVRVADQFVVCPDNGLVSWCIRSADSFEARVIKNAELLPPSPSTTFHGRDVFAPIAAHLASGVAFEEVGLLLEKLIALPYPEPVVKGDLVQGEIIHIDHFGNAITNIPRSRISGHSNMVITAGDLECHEVHDTYGNVGDGKALAVIGSTEHVELSVNKGNAALIYKFHRGTVVQIELR